MTTGREGPAALLDLRRAAGRDAPPRRNRPILPWLLLSFVLAGCNLGGQTYPPLLPADLLDKQAPPSELVQTAATTTTETAPSPPAGSGPLLRSPDPSATAEVFTLPDAIRFALQHSPRLKSARADIYRTEGLEQAAFAPFLPQVDVLTRVGATSRALSPGAPGPTGAIVPSVIGTGYTFAQSELQLQWVLCDFGRTAGRYHQAVSQEKIAQLRFERAQETVAFDVATEYLSVLLASAARAIQKEAIRRAEAVLKDARVRLTAGAADRDAVLRADVQVAEARDALVVAENAEWEALARLNAVMGRPAALPLQVSDTHTEPAFFLSLAQCLEAAEASRREVAVAREVIAAARSGKDAVAAGFLPSLSARSSLGYVDGDHVVQGLQEGAALHLNLPLYAGGRLRGEMRAANAEAAQALAGSLSVLDSVTLEVTVAYRSVVTARARIELARPPVAEAAENLRLVRVKFRNGNADSTNIADAEATLTRVTQRDLSAGYEYLNALSRLDYALGRRQGSFLDDKADQPAKGKPPSELPSTLLDPPRPVPKGP